MELRRGAGAYIAGEETALFESIEGDRPEPRNKPPFPGTNGLWNQPTAINNVETFTFATVILSRGADWFKAQGTNGASGTKFVGISGDVNRPGIYVCFEGVADTFTASAIRGDYIAKGTITPATTPQPRKRHAGVFSTPR